MGEDRSSVSPAHPGCELWSEHDVVLRHAIGRDYPPQHTLAEVTQRERVRIIHGCVYREVTLDLLDLTTGSPTGTFKDWLASVVIADCRAKSIRRFVAQTSGNTGVALSAYSQDAGIEPVLFYPAASRAKFSSRFISRDATRFIEVELPEPKLKERAATFATLLQLPLLPTLQHQLLANRLRASILNRAYVEAALSYDWHVQSVSAGYGPFGLYEGLELLHASGGRVVPIPRFLGIQQSAVCPYARHLQHSLDTTIAVPSHTASESVIEPTLFHSNPSEAFRTRMTGLCRTSRGTMRVVDAAAFAHNADDAVSIVERLGLKLELSSPGPKPELAGVLAVSGALHAIDEGLVAPGARALIAITGGARVSESHPASLGEVLHSDADEDLLALARTLRLG